MIFWLVSSYEIPAGAEDQTIMEMTVSILMCNSSTDHRFRATYSWWITEVNKYMVVVCGGPEIDVKTWSVDPGHGPVMGEV